MTGFQAILDVKGFDGALGMLQKLPPELVSKRGGAVLRALKKGARLLRDEAEKNLINAIAAPSKSGITISTGFLVKNLYFFRGKMKRDTNGERVVVGIKRAMYPDGTSTLKVASIMEYGSSKQPAIPWIRPAAIMKRQEIVNTIAGALSDDIVKISKKLAKGR